MVYVLNKIIGVTRYLLTKFLQKNPKVC